MLDGLGSFLITPEGEAFWLVTELVLWGSVIAAALWPSRPKGG